jgi:hypothetical protein
MPMSAGLYKPPGRFASGVIVAHFVGATALARIYAPLSGSA